MCTTIFYHAHCLDGSTAALAAWLALGDEGVRYAPLAYGAPLPTDIEAGSDIYFLDVTPSRQVLLDLAQTAGRITIIDHHASAQSAIADLTDEAANTLGACWIRTIFDLEHSGAVLAWNHWHHSPYPIPRLFSLIEDRDLWRFQFPKTKPLHYALECLPHSENPRLLADYIASPSAIDAAVERGRAILDYLAPQWEHIAARASDPLYWPHGPLGDRVIRYRLINCPPAWFSDVGHRALATHLNTDIICLYHDTCGSDRRSYSLRSRPNGPDCARLAAQLGGGGHPSAAGFTLDIRANAYLDLITAKRPRPYPLHEAA